MYDVMGVAFEGLPVLLAWLGLAWVGLVWFGLVWFGLEFIALCGAASRIGGNPSPSLSLSRHFLTGDTDPDLQHSFDNDVAVLYKPAQLGALQEAIRQVTRTRVSMG